MCFFGKQRYVAVSSARRRRIQGARSPEEDQRSHTICSLPPLFASLPLNLRSRILQAIACLKRALYLDPFEWIISYNLGLVHLNTGQYASAFHYFSTSINLKPDFPSSYMYLGITLSRLEDFENACAAYEKAIEMENAAEAAMEKGLTKKKTKKKPTKEEDMSADGVEFVPISG